MTEIIINENFIIKADSNNLTVCRVKVKEDEFGQEVKTYKALKYFTTIEHVLNWLARELILDDHADEAMSLREYLDLLNQNIAHLAKVCQS